MSTGCLVYVNKTAIKKQKTSMVVWGLDLPWGGFYGEFEFLYTCFFKEFGYAFSVWHGVKFLYSDSGLGAIAAPFQDLQNDTHVAYKV